MSENTFVAVAEMTGLANVEEIINGNVVLIITEPEEIFYQQSKTG